MSPFHTKAGLLALASIALLTACGGDGDQELDAQMPDLE